MEGSAIKVQADSDVALLEEADVNESKTLEDPLSSSHPTWSSRYHCIEAYMCVLLNFFGALHFCRSLGKYGYVIFLPQGVFTVFIGAPAVLVEILCGRYVMDNVTRAWTMCPPAKGILYCLMGSSIVSIAQSSVCNLYLLKYFFSLFDEKLDWVTCEPTWAKINCYDIGKKESALFACYKTYSEEYCRNLTWESSAVQYWKYKIGSTADVKDATWSVVCLLLSVTLTAVINCKWIRSFEKMCVLLVCCPFVLEIIMVFTTFISPGALFGLFKFWNSQWKSLLDVEVIWIQGFEDTFVFLGLGKLSLSFVSCHGKFTDNIMLELLITTCGGFFSSVLVSIPLLSMLANAKNLDPKENNSEEPFKDIEDVFVSMSEAMVLYPFPITLWSVLHYLNWFLISFAGQVVLVLAVGESFAALFGKLDKFYIVISAFSAAMCFFGVFFLFTRLQFKVDLSTVSAVIVFLTTITWQLFYGIGKLNNDYYFMMGYPLPIFLKFTWLTLLILTGMGLSLKIYYKMPDEPLKCMVYIYVGIPVLIYLLNFFYEILKNHKRNVSSVFIANPDWGPDNLLLKKSRIIFDTGNVTKEFMYRQELNKKPSMKPPDFSEQNIVQLV